MSKRILSLALVGFIAIILINWSCTKLDTISIGSDLIPAVDNVNTFADTFPINTTQGVFEGIFKDSTKLALTDNYAIGKTADPLFGGTEAKLFLQLKPGFYPYYIGIPLDTILTRDSVVLCLNYKGHYGDTLSQIQLQVNEVSHSAHGEWDTLRTLRDINYAPAIGAAISAPTTVNIASLASYTKIRNGKDSVKNQIRIKLSDAFAQALFSQDSTRGTGAFSRDTLFRAFNNGFVVTMTNGNALLYTSLSDANTRLELHYTRKNGGPKDSSVSTFLFNDGSQGSSAPSRSAVANNVVRTRNTLPTGDQEIYLQTSPGTYASLKVPMLTGYSNRIIHRAEIQMEQIPGDPVTDGYFKEPNYLYMDLVDSGTTNKWKPIYYDLNPSTRYDPDFTSGYPYFPSSGEVDFSYFGGYARKKTDGAGTKVYYTINITRYIQQLVTKQTPNYEMRLFAPKSFSYPQYSATVIPYVNNIAEGRIRLGGGNNLDPNLRMRLKIIYSKLQ